MIQKFGRKYFVKAYELTLVNLMFVKSNVIHWELVVKDPIVSTLESISG